MTSRSFARRRVSLTRLRCLPTTGRSLATIVASLRGREGSAVLLKVQDDAGSTVVTVTRKLLARKGNDYEAR